MIGFWIWQVAEYPLEPIPSPLIFLAFTAMMSAHCINSPIEKTNKVIHIHNFIQLLVMSLLITKHSNLVIVPVKPAITSGLQPHPQSPTITERIGRRRSRSESSRSADSAEGSEVLQAGSCGELQIGGASPTLMSIITGRIQQSSQRKHARDSRDGHNPPPQPLSPTKRQNLKPTKPARKIDGADPKLNQLTTCQCYQRKCLADQCACFRDGRMCGDSCGCYQCRNNQDFEDRLNKAKGRVADKKGGDGTGDYCK